MQVPVNHRRESISGMIATPPSEGNPRINPVRVVSFRSGHGSLSRQDIKNLPHIGNDFTLNTLEFSVIGTAMGDTERVTRVILVHFSYGIYYTPCRRNEEIGTQDKQLFRENYMITQLIRNPPPTKKKRGVSRTLTSTLHFLLNP